MDALDLKEELIAAFPPGIEKIIDWDDDPGKLLEVCAHVLKEHGTDPVGQLRLELNPATANQKVLDWEQATGLEQTSIAARGSVLERQQQVISRLREVGPTTLAAIRAVIQPLFQYANPSQIVILEVDRMIARKMHTYSWMGSLALSSTVQTISWKVDDGVVVSRAGAQIDLTLDTTAVELLSLTLHSPNLGKTLVNASLGQGAKKGTLRAYFKDMAGVSIGGVWMLEITASLGSTLTQADLFVEGMGRDARFMPGRGALKFYWGVVAEEDKLGNLGSYDLKAAQDSIVRINYARNKASLILRSKGVGKLPPGQFAAIPDDPNTIPDMCIPG